MRCQTRMCGMRSLFKQSIPTEKGKINDDDDDDDDDDDENDVFLTYIPHQQENLQ